MKAAMLFVVLLALTIYGYQHYRNKSQPKTVMTPQVRTMTLEEVDSIPPTYNDHSPPPVTAKAVSPAKASFSCDGRTHCSQMTSCAEATYFLKHCPNPQMDGNGDGIPCEKQWCN